MNSDEAARLANELAWNHRVQVRKTGPNPDDFDVVVLDDSSPDPTMKGVAKAIDRRLGRMQHILEERARHDIPKAENLRSIRKVVRSYLRKIQKLRERPDVNTEMQVELDQIHHKLGSVSNVLSRIIETEMVGGIPGGDPLDFARSLDMYHRVSRIAAELSERLKGGQGGNSSGRGQRRPGGPQKKTLGGKVVPQFCSAKKRKKP